MFYNSYAYRPMQPDSYIRVFHASPDAPAVDVYANGNLIVKELAYKQFSQYIPLLAGNCNIQVYPSGQMTNPVINTNVYIPPNTVFNVAAIGNLSDISLYLIPEPTTGQNFGRPCIRFVHLSPNAPAVDIRLSQGTKLFDAVSYKDITVYACIPSNIYTFTINLAGTGNTVLTVPNVRLDPNNYYTIYIVGEAKGDPGLEAVVALEPRA